MVIVNTPDHQIIWFLEQTSLYVQALKHALGTYQLKMTAVLQAYIL